MKRIEKLVTPLFAAILSLTAPRIIAEVNCEPRVSQEIGAHLSCTSASVGMGTTVSFRRISSWSGNAGMTLIELCSQNLETIEGKVQQVGDIKYLAIPGQYVEGELGPSESDRSCIRRYCTQVSDSFSIFVETVPIPISPFFWLGGAIGISNSEFAITCKAIEVNGG